MTVCNRCGQCCYLFKDDELIDRIVPELTLMGIAAATKHALAAKDADTDATP